MLEVEVGEGVLLEGKGSEFHFVVRERDFLEVVGR